MSKPLNIIFSTHNEMELGYLQKSIPLLSEFKDIHITVVDKESNDGTVQFLESYPVEIISTKVNSRAGRLNIGINSSSSAMILLHHPRSILSKEGISFLIENYENLRWGAYTHRFDVEHSLLKFTSWYSNFIRGGLREIYYLDHCIFFQKVLVGADKNFVPDVDIFEDTYLSQKLAKNSSPTRLPFSSTTSAIRFQKNGVWKQAILNQILKLGFLLGIPNTFMNKVYEKGLNLNSKY